MKEFWSKTYRIGKLTVSLAPKNVVVFYRGDRKIYLYTFYRNPFSPLMSRLFKRRMKKEPLPLVRLQAGNPARKNTFKLRFTIGVAGAVRVALIPVLITGAVFLGYALLSGSGNKGADISDEEQKNRLIHSANTDYSDPEHQSHLMIRVHKVQKGETLSEIAREYGVSMDTICGNNKLVSYDIIQEGALLKIPNKDGILHTIIKGQDLHSIAKKYKISVENIVAENSIKNSDFLPVGEDIFLPDAKPLNLVPGFLWPTACRRITCGYGWRRNPFNHAEYEFHKGIDIRANYEWVRATKYGKVTYTGWLGGYGKTVLIAHPDGWKSLYGHLSRVSVRVGQYVKQGQYVGRSGNTGLSTGPHLHFELIKSGRNINPYRYIH